MYKAENKLTKVQKRCLKNKDPVHKTAKKQEDINADPTGGTGWKVPPEDIFDGLQKKKKKKK
jgi:hypothetical protein